MRFISIQHTHAPQGFHFSATNQLEFTSKGFFHARKVWIKNARIYQVYKIKKRPATYFSRCVPLVLFRGKGKNWHFKPITAWHPRATVTTQL